MDLLLWCGKWCKQLLYIRNFAGNWIAFRSLLHTFVNLPSVFTGFLATLNFLQKKLSDFL